MAKSQFDKINAKIRDRQDRIFRGSFVQLTQRTISAWPVDTGYSKASWLFGVGAPINDVSDNLGRDPLSSIQVEIKNFKIGQSAFMTNATPYALPLEFGWSSQMPSGVVRKLAAQWAVINNKVARSIK